MKDVHLVLYQGTLVGEMCTLFYTRDIKQNMPNKVTADMMDDVDITEVRYVWLVVHQGICADQLTLIKQGHLKASIRELQRNYSVNQGIFVDQQTLMKHSHLKVSTRELHRNYSVDQGIFVDQHTLMKHGHLKAGTRELHRHYSVYRENSLLKCRSISH